MPLQCLRRRLRLTQHDLARRIGAANKAIVYQWESRQLRPSPIFRKKVEALGAIRLDSSLAPIASNVSPRDLVDALASDSKEESAAYP